MCSDLEGPRAAFVIRWWISCSQSTRPRSVSGMVSTTGRWATSRTTSSTSHSANTAGRLAWRDGQNRRVQRERREMFAETPRAAARAKPPRRRPSVQVGEDALPYSGPKWTRARLVALGVDALVGLEVPLHHLVQRRPPDGADGRPSARDRPHRPARTPATPNSSGTPRPRTARGPLGGTPFEPALPGIRRTRRVPLPNSGRLVRLAGGFAEDLSRPRCSRIANRD